MAPIPSTRRLRYDPPVTRRTLGVTTCWIGAIACISLACGSSSTDEPPQAAPLPPDALGARGVLVENRTDHSIVVGIRDVQSLQIDRRVLDGSLVVPIAPAAFGSVREAPLEAKATTLLSNTVAVVTSTNVLPQFGGVFNIGGGPFLLAVGDGRIVVQTRNGRDVAEAEDPRAVVVVPVDRDVPPCAAGAFGDDVDEVPRAINEGRTLDVVSVTRNGACRVLRLDGEGIAPFDYELCVPDAAFPFADDAAIVMASDGTGGITLLDGSNSVDFTPLRFNARMPVESAGIAFTSVDEPACATIDTCRNVAIPAHALLSFDGKTSRELRLGESLVDPRNAARTIVLVGARSRPAWVQGCVTGNNAPEVSTELVIAIATRGP